MKKLQKISSYLLVTVMAFLVSLSTVFAAGGTANNESLSAGQIIGGLAVLLLVILVPILKGGKRVTVNHK